MNILHSTQDAIIYSITHLFLNMDGSSSIEDVSKIFCGRLLRTSDPGQDIDRHMNFLGDFTHTSPYGDLASTSRLLASHATVRIRFFPNGTARYEEFCGIPRPEPHVIWGGEKPHVFGKISSPHRFGIPSFIISPPPRSPISTSSLIHREVPGIFMPLQTCVVSDFTNSDSEGVATGFIDFYFLFAQMMESSVGPFSRFFVQNKNSEDVFKMEFPQETLLHLGLLTALSLSRKINVCSTLWGEWV